MPSQVNALDLTNFSTRLFAANVSAASITIPAPTNTEPVAGANGVMDLRTGRDRLATFANAAVAFFATGADNVTATARVTGWKKISTLWVPFTLAKLDLTASAAVGVAAGDVLNTERFVDTLANTGGSAVDSSAVLLSPADNAPALAIFNTRGFQYLQIDLAKGTATDVNAIAAKY